MVSLIQELHRVKGYAEDTFYLAVSVADRYLTILTTQGKKAPNLIQLATISILLAAKMYQHMNPCFDMMIERLPNLLRKQVTREQLITLEEQIIRALDFNLQNDGPLPFLERYQRVLNIDNERENQYFYKIGYSARKLLRHMMHKSTFLSYRPSQIASTAILVAIDLNKNDKKGAVTCRVQSPQIDNFEQSCAQESVTPKADSRCATASNKMMNQDNEYELNMQQHSRASSTIMSPKAKVANSQQQTIEKAWTRQTSYYTQVSKTRDILPVLKQLVASLE